MANKRTKREAEETGLIRIKERVWEEIQRKGKIRWKYLFKRFQIVVSQEELQQTLLVLFDEGKVSVLGNWIGPRDPGEIPVYWPSWPGHN